MVRDMTKGRPLPIIVRFSIPLLLGTLFQQLYNMTDSVIVGRAIGSHALAAVGTTGALNFFVLGFVVGLCSGFCIPVSQRFGAGDITEMRRFAANVIFLCVFFAIVLTTLTVIFTRQLLHLIDVPEEIIELSYSYIIFIFGGIPAAMAYNILASMLRALGDSKSPLYFLAIASIINVLLDILFILVLGTGVMGAGIATVIAQTVSAVLCFVYIRSNYPILRFTKEEAKFSPEHAKKLLSMGVPMGLQFSITALGALVLQRAVNGLGTPVIAGLTTGNRISLLFFQPMEALGLTLATFCGQNLGAKKLDRIRQGIRLSMIIQMAYCVLAGLILWFFGRTFAGIFIESSELEILDNVKFQLRILGASYFSIGILFIFRNTLQGLGYSVMAMSAGVCELVGRVFVAFLLVGRFGFYGVCFAGPLSWILADAVLIPAYFIVMKRLRNKIGEDDKSPDIPQTVG
ncbi:MAG: MATE family efflux transporter [Oscillospiraceae bacterium]|nr:MATE family efflux transporter [Oscillospiraceae bacterium]